MDKKQQLLDFYNSIEPYIIDILNSEDIYRNVWEIIQEFPDEVCPSEFEERIRNETKYWLRKNEIAMDEEGKLIEVLLEYEVISQIIGDNQDYLDELDNGQIVDYNKNIFKIYLILNSRLYKICGVEFHSINDHIRSEGFNEVIKSINNTEDDKEQKSTNLLGWE